tara:strand:- start:4722 stop:6074 length:1353 start_codon:yes stop_codon:yes gene_type:complete
MLNVSSESTFLIDYYDNLLKVSNNAFNFSLDNSKKTSCYSQLQKTVYDKLDSIYDILDKDLCNIQTFRKIYDNNSREYRSLLQNIYNQHFVNNRYIDDNIKEYIKNKPGSLVIYTLPYKNKYITINLFKYSKISPNYVKTLDKIIKNMMAQIYLITNLTKNNTCSDTGLSIYLFFTPFKRKLEKKRENVLGATNANGGFCYGCVSLGKIVVYREEEFFKVFSHELIHNFGVDKYIWDFISSAKIKNSKEFKLYHKFLNNFNLGRENDLGLQECLVEFWGEFFNNVIYSYIYSKSCNLSDHNHKFKIYNHIFETIMKFEIIHSFFQTTKIVYHNNTTYIDILSKYNKNTLKYRENTHIFSYYMLKLYLIFNYKLFVNSEISVSRENTIKFSNSLRNMQQFFNYMSSVATDNSLLLNFKFMEKIYLHLKSQKKGREINFLLSNLRMSVLQYH